MCPTLKLCTARTNEILNLNTSVVILYIMFQPNDGAPPGYAEADVAQKQSADEVAISVYENQRYVQVSRCAV